MKGLLSSDKPFPAQVADREVARAAFAQHADMSNVGYIRVEIEDGKRVCVLYDARGYCLKASYSGQVPLISYAIERDMTLATVH